TLNPKPSTLHPPPSTLHPKPSTLNPQPSTPNPPISFFQSPKNRMTYTPPHGLFRVSGSGVRVQGLGFGV
ncbi:hypothetical protein T484DRAFT_1627665, partial [Baffinella frigidus]